MSKGAICHYVDFMQALIAAIVERLAIEAETILTPIVQDPRLPAQYKDGSN